LNDKNDELSSPLLQFYFSVFVSHSVSQKMLLTFILPQGDFRASAKITGAWYDIFK
jgi:hypothetical protein